MNTVPRQPREGLRARGVQDDQGLVDAHLSLFDSLRGRWPHFGKSRIQTMDTGKRMGCSSRSSEMMGGEKAEPASVVLTRWRV